MPDDNFDFSTWFIEDLDYVGSSEIKLGGPNNTSIYKKAQGKVKAQVIIDKPRWRSLRPNDYNLIYQPGSSFFLVRVALQFPELENDSSINQAIIQVFLEGPPNKAGSNPKVTEIFPTEVFDGDLQKVNLKISPSMKLLNMEIGLGDIGFETSIGQVAPETIGWTGEHERSPYWKLKPKTKKLIGLRHFWMVVDRPIDCQYIRLSVLVDLIVATKKYGLIPIGPKQRERNFLKYVDICMDSK